MGIIPFQFEDKAVRVVRDENGEPLFVGKDVCDALGYADHAGAMRRHCKGALKRRPLQTDGGTQEMLVLAEPDVMRLLVHSKLPAAQAFERMVFEEILPAIRRTGQYAAPQAEQPGKEPAKLGVDWLARSMHNAQKVIQMAAGRVGMAVVAEETPDFSHPDIAMGLAGLMFAQQRFLVEMESLESAKIRALHLKERIVDLRPDDWAERFLRELNRAQAVQIMQAATRKLA